MAVEVKRIGEIAGVDQLIRYQERLDRDTRLAPTRGMFVATRIKPPGVSSTRNAFAIPNRLSSSDALIISPSVSRFQAPRMRPTPCEVFNSFLGAGRSFHSMSRLSKSLRCRAATYMERNDRADSGRGSSVRP